MPERDFPNFAAWDRKNLDDYANDAYRKINEQEAALAQLRQDLRDAMKIARENHGLEE